MKKEVTVTIAALGFISSAVGIHAYATSDNYVQGTAGECPLVINLSSEFDREVIENEKIQSLTFSIDCKTNLDETRAYLTQGQVYYYTDSTLNHRNFADLVAVNDDDYEWIAHQNSVCTEFIVGSEERPLYADLDKDITISWTWITPEKLSVYELYVTTTDGLTYPISVGEDFYTVEISEEMEEDRIQTVANTSDYMFPLKGRYCITSVYGWDGDRWHDAIDTYSYDDDNIYSACDGIVEKADWENPYDYSQGYGRMIKVTDDNGYSFFYGHLSEIDVEVGQRVNKGDKLGVIGSSGFSTGIHLDFSAQYYGQEVDITQVVGITNNYGDYAAITDAVISDDLLAVKCLTVNKEFEAGYLGANAIRSNDSGAVALGICQWNGCNARDMLKYLYKNNKDGYINIAHKYNDGYINYLDKSDSWWNSHSISDGDNEYNFYTELLDNDEMIRLQYEYALAYMREVVADAHEHNITEEKAVMLFAKIRNVLPYAGVAEQMRNGYNTFDDATVLFMNDPNTNRHEDVINFINSDFDLVTIESLKGER